MELFEFFKGVNFFMQIMIVLIFGLYLVVLYIFLNYKFKRMIKRKEDFHDKLTKALQMGTIESIDDIFNLYKGINDYNSPNDRYRNSVNTLLRSYIVGILDLPNEQVNQEEVKTWKETISNYIKINEEESPFSNLPDAERNIVNDILMYLNTGNNTGVKTKIKEISVHIQSKSEKIIDLEKKYKTSGITAVIGLILTVLFGIASLL